MRKLTLSTTPFLTSAIRLYEREGFSRKKSAPPDFFGTTLFMTGKLLA